MAEIKEDTHLVMKFADIKDYLSEADQQSLFCMSVAIAKARLKDDKEGHHKYLVVNKDEPYADDVQRIILKGEDAKQVKEV